MSIWFKYFFALLAAERLIELLIARRNAQWMRSRGAVEYGIPLTRVIVGFHVTWFAGLVYEASLTGAEPLLSPLLPFILFLLLQAGRYWCILTLGRFWNTRILILPGHPPVVRGPYRWIRHPNYWVVRLEMFLYPWAFQCWITGLVGGLINLLLLHFRIRQEDEALGRSRSPAPSPD